MYSAIVGSMSHGLDISLSDVDVGYVGRRPSVKFNRRIDYKLLKTYELVELIAGDLYNRVYFTQWLYPERFLSRSPVVDYILENRDRIIGTSKTKLIRTLLPKDHIVRSLLNPEIPCPKKVLAYQLLHYSILINYADGMPFADAHKPTGGGIHDLLLGIREGAAISEGRNLLVDYRSKMQSRLKFYENSSPTMELFHEFSSVVNEEYRGDDLYSQETTG